MPAATAEWHVVAGAIAQAEKVAQYPVRGRRMA